MCISSISAEKMNRIVLESLTFGHFAKLLIVKDRWNVEPEVKAGLSTLKLNFEVAPHLLLEPV